MVCAYVCATLQNLTSMALASLLIGIFTFVQLNCENLIDYMHDEGKDDTEFLPDGSYHWNKTRYWRKLNRTGQTIVACSDTSTMLLPDMALLCEVENDTVMRDLTRRSLLRTARYDYVMTHSPDQRGIDVALIYSPMSFRLIESHSVSVPPVKGMRPTRDILYVKGITASDDTLHVIGAHFPSRRGGERQSRPFRRHAAARLCAVVDSVLAVSRSARVIVAGDFNMYSDDGIMADICSHGLTDVSATARGRRGAKGTYRYQGQWGSLDHILVSASVLSAVSSCHVQDDAFLTEDDTKYGGIKPRRNYLGPVYRNGFSDHLPLVCRLAF